MAVTDASAVAPSPGSPYQSAPLVITNCVFDFGTCDTYGGFAWFMGGAAATSVTIDGLVMKASAQQLQPQYQEQQHYYGSLLIVDSHLDGQSNVTVRGVVVGNEVTLGTPVFQIMGVAYILGGVTVSVNVSIIAASIVAAGASNTSGVLTGMWQGVYIDVHQATSASIIVAESEIFFDRASCVSAVAVDITPAIRDTTLRFSSNSINMQFDPAVRIGLMCGLRVQPLQVALHFTAASFSITNSTISMYGNAFASYGVQIGGLQVQGSAADLAQATSMQSQRLSQVPEVDSRGGWCYAGANAIDRGGMRGATRLTADTFMAGQYDAAHALFVQADLDGDAHLQAANNTIPPLQPITPAQLRTALFAAWATQPNAFTSASTGFDGCSPVSWDDAAYPPRAVATVTNNVFNISFTGVPGSAVSASNVIVIAILFDSGLTVSNGASVAVDSNVLTASMGYSTNYTSSSGIFRLISVRNGPLTVANLSTFIVAHNTFSYEATPIANLSWVVHSLQLSFMTLSSVVATRSSRVAFTGNRFGAAAVRGQQSFDPMFAVAIAGSPYGSYSQTTTMFTVDTTVVVSNASALAILSNAFTATGPSRYSALAVVLQFGALSATNSSEADWPASLVFANNFIRIPDSANASYANVVHVASMEALQTSLRNSVTGNAVLVFDGNSIDAASTTTAVSASAFKINAQLSAAAALLISRTAVRLSVNAALLASFTLVSTLFGTIFTGAMYAIAANSDVAVYSSGGVGSAVIAGSFGIAPGGGFMTIVNNSAFVAAQTPWFARTVTISLWCSDPSREQMLASMVISYNSVALRAPSRVLVTPIGGQNGGLQIYPNVVGDAIPWSVVTIASNRWDFTYMTNTGVSAGAWPSGCNRCGFLMITLWRSLTSYSFQCSVRNNVIINTAIPILLSVATVQTSVRNATVTFDCFNNVMTTLPVTTQAGRPPLASLLSTSAVNLQSANQIISVRRCSMTVNTGMQQYYAAAVRLLSTNTSGGGLIRVADSSMTILNVSDPGAGSRFNPSYPQYSVAAVALGTNVSLLSSGSHGSAIPATAAAVGGGLVVERTTVVALGAATALATLLQEDVTGFSIDSGNAPVPNSGLAIRFTDVKVTVSNLSVAVWASAALLPYLGTDLTLQCVRTSPVAENASRFVWRPLRAVAAVPTATVTPCTATVTVSNRGIGDAVLYLTASPASTRLDFASNSSIVAASSTVASVVCSTTEGGSRVPAACFAVATSCVPASAYITARTAVNSNASVLATMSNASWTLPVPVVTVRPRSTAPNEMYGTATLTFVNRTATAVTSGAPVDAGTVQAQASEELVVVVEFPVTCFTVPVVAQRRVQLVVPLVLPPPPPPPLIPKTVVAAVQNTVTASVVLSGITGSPTAATQAARSNFLLQLANCDPQFVPLGFSDSPTGAVLTNEDVRYLFGAAVMNLVLLICWIALNAFVGYLYSRATHKTAAEGLAWARFPSASVFPIMFLMQTETTSALACVAFGSTLTSGVGTVILITWLCIFVAGIYFFRRVFPNYAVYHAATKRQTKSLAVVVFGRQGHWENATPGFDIVRHMASVFDDYGVRAPWFILIELATNVVLGGAAALTQVAGCPGTSYVAVGVYVIYIALLLYFRPHNRTFDFGFTLLLASAQALVAGLIVLQLSGSDSSALSDSINIVTMATMLLMVLRGGYDVVMTVKEVCLTKFGARRPRTPAMRHADALMAIEAMGTGDADDDFYELDDTDPEKAMTSDAIALVSELRKAEGIAASRANASTVPVTVNALAVFGARTHAALVIDSADAAESQNDDEVALGPSSPRGAQVESRQHTPAANVARIGRTDVDNTPSVMLGVDGVAAEADGEGTPSPFDVLDGPLVVPSYYAPHLHHRVAASAAQSPQTSRLASRRPSFDADLEALLN